MGVDGVKVEGWCKMEGFEARGGDEEGEVKVWEGWKEGYQGRVGGGEDGC